jgi:membrane protease YdiL (CAAX protease family)
MEETHETSMGLYTSEDRHIDIKTRHSYHTAPLAVFLTVIGALALMIGAEILSAFVGAMAGGIVDGVLLVVLVNLAYFIKIGEARRVILPLMLIPLMRILSVAAPVPQFSMIFWYVLIGFPLLSTLMIYVYAYGLPGLSAKLTARKWVLQFLFGLVGIPLGIIAWRIMPVSNLILPSRTMGWIIGGGIVLTLFNALTDEMIFRGFVQEMLLDVFGSIGLVVAAALYSSMFIGTLQLSYVVFFGLMGFLFSLWVKRTGSLWGVLLAHSIFNFLFLILLVP